MSKELKRIYPRGCMPPTGYCHWHDWAKTQGKDWGLKQTRCSRCLLWHFPQEIAGHECIAKACTGQS